MGKETTLQQMKAALSFCAIAFLYAFASAEEAIFNTPTPEAVLMGETSLQSDDRHGDNLAMVVHHDHDDGDPAVNHDADPALSPPYGQHSEQAREPPVPTHNVHKQDYTGVLRQQQRRHNRKEKVNHVLEMVTHVKDHKDSGDPAFDPLTDPAFGPANNDGDTEQDPVFANDGPNTHTDNTVRHKKGTDVLELVSHMKDGGDPAFDPLTDPAFGPANNDGDTEQDSVFANDGPNTHTDNTVRHKKGTDVLELVSHMKD